MNIDTKIATISEALSKTLFKDTSVNVGKFKYKFVPLIKIEQQLRPLCAQHGLRFWYPSRTDAQGAAIVDLESGESREAAMGVSISKNVQETGGQMTYLRRYCLLGVLGLTPDEDDDGNSSEHSKIGAQLAAKYAPPANVTDLDSLRNWVDQKRDIIKTSLKKDSKYVSLALTHWANARGIDRDEVMSTFKSVLYAKKT